MSIYESDTILVCVCCWNQVVTVESLETTNSFQTQYLRGIDELNHKIISKTNQLICL